jgi:hypothetical protein
LSQNMIRVAELAGLFGVNLSGGTGSGTVGRKASVAVKSLPSISPLGSLNFVAIRQGSGSSLRREIHLHSPQTGANGSRIVQSLVDGERWDNLAFRARLGVTYVLMKTRWFESSLHRQWGKQATINWIIGLCNFYKDHTGLRLGIGDISHIVGEAMTDHASHRLGRDVDVYVLDYLGWGPYPEAFWCNNTATSFTMTSMLPPTNPGGIYNPSGGIQLAGVYAAEIWRRYAIVLAYCFATWSVLKTFTWHGVRQPQLQTNAMAIAQAAFDTGWQSSWGSAPKSRADLAPSVAERNQKLIGQGSSIYGTGKAWPLHQDHMHIRLDL